MRALSIRQPYAELIDDGAAVAGDVGGGGARCARPGNPRSPPAAGYPAGVGRPPNNSNFRIRPSQLEMRTGEPTPIRFLAGSPIGVRALCDQLEVEGHRPGYFASVIRLTNSSGPH